MMNSYDDNTLDRGRHQRQGRTAGSQQRRLRHRTVQVLAAADASTRTLGLPANLQGIYYTTTTGY